MSVAPAHQTRRPTRRTVRAAKPRGPWSELVDGAWRVAEAITTPLLPDDYLDLINPLRAGADLRGRVVDIRHETADAATVVIKPGRGWRPHRPGQYVRIGIDVDGVRQWRAYSITSPPAADGTITITVKAIPDGVVSQYIVRRAQPGILVMLDQATGDFVLPRVLPHRCLFITAGSGITPVMGILRNHVDDLTDVVVLHSSPTPDDVIFREELHRLGSRAHVSYVERHTDHEGMLDLAELDDLVPDWRQRETWACGPTGLLDDAETHWESIGVEENLHTERFRPTIIEPGDGGEICFDTVDTVVEADGATTILDAGEAAGLVMPSGCRMGICFGCTVTMTSGAVRDLRNGDITTAEPGDDVSVQTCINAVAGECHLDL